MDSSENDLLLGLIRLSDIVLDATQKVVAKHGLSQASFEALMTLRGQPEPRRMTPTELYRSILISSGGMTKVLKLLERDGLIAREDNPEDRRSRYVQLTEAGRIRAEVVMEAVREQDQMILGKSLSAQQIRQLGQLLLTTVASIETACTNVQNSQSGKN